MPFDLNQLRYALCVSQHGSLHIAASALGMSVALLKREISALETRIGLTLFEPAGDGLRSTQRGGHFLHDAEHLLWRAEQVALRLARAHFPLRAAPFPHFEVQNAPGACGCEDGPEELGADATEVVALARNAQICRYANLARAILAAHKRAGRAFGNDLISDPASEMLLDLYVREHEGLTTSITSFWGAATSALGTARRSWTMMERRGFVTRTGDPHDGRRVLVQLTSTARAQLEGCFEVILESASHSVVALTQPEPERATG